MASRTRSGRAYQPPSTVVHIPSKPKRQSKGPSLPARRDSRPSTTSFVTLPDEVKQAILLALDGSSKKLARFVCKAWAALLISGFKSARFPLGKASDITAAAVAALRRFIASFPDLQNVELSFEDDNKIDLVTVASNEGPSKAVRLWTQQMRHWELATAIAALKHLTTLTLVSTEMLPLISYCSLSTLRALDISKCRVPHEQLQLIPHSLTQLTSLALDKGRDTCREGRMTAEDLASLAQLSHLQRLEFGAGNVQMTLAEMQVLGSLTSLTELHMAPNTSKCLRENAWDLGLAFVHLAPLSKLTRLHTLDTAGLACYRGWLPLGLRVQSDEQCVPSRELLSSWFPALQQLRYSAGVPCDRALTAVAAMTKGRLQLVMHKLGCDFQRGLQQETEQALAQLQHIEVSASWGLIGAQQRLAQLPNVTYEVVHHKPSGGHTQPYQGCRCIWCEKARGKVGLVG